MAAISKDLNIANKLSHFSCIQMSFMNKAALSNNLLPTAHVHVFCCLAATLYYRQRMCIIFPLKIKSLCQFSKYN